MNIKGTILNGIFYYTRLKQLFKKSNKRCSETGGFKTNRKSVNKCNLNNRFNV